jgi:molybdopterin molybdotransferase
MSTRSRDDCASPAADLLSVEQALQLILDRIEPLATGEQIDVRSAVGRVLADGVVSPMHVPPFDNSAMDGYALRSGDSRQTSRITLALVGSSFAGHPFTGRVGTGECIRIMTGAMMPDGADAVVMQEHVQREAERVSLSGPVEAGVNVRRRGDDIKPGDGVLAAGKKLGAAEIGLLASMGIGEVRVMRRPRVAFFSTGDELTGVGTVPGEGQIYDSNRYSLFGMLTQLGLPCVDLGVVPDRPDAVRSTLKQAAEAADLILASGGVSVGDADYVTDALAELGNVGFWRVAMKPGKPLAFGAIDKAMFFGLPGNPVSAMVTFYQFVLPAIRKLSGETARDSLLIQARCSADLKKSPGRTEFQRGRLERAADGGWRVSSTGLQESHLLRSMSKANCLIHLPAESDGAREGELVTVQPFLDFYY